MKLRHYLLAFALLILGGCATQGIKQQADVGKLDIYEEFATELIPTRTVYMDYGDGTLDANYAPFQAQVDALFEAKGWTKPHYVTLLFPGHNHDETSWQKRLHIPLELLLGTE